jgi:hypothetical protein
LRNDRHVANAVDSIDRRGRQIAMSDDEFIPYLILVRFDKGEDLRDRLHESLPLLQNSLKELGEAIPALSSYDGSAVAYLLSARPSVQPEHVLAHLRTAKSHEGAPLKTQDKVLVISVELGLASRLDLVTDWLRNCGALA